AALPPCVRASQCQLFTTSRHTSGGRGIRTPGAVNPAVFKTAAIVHSAIPPLLSIPHPLSTLEEGMKKGLVGYKKEETVQAQHRSAVLSLNCLFLLCASVGLPKLCHCWHECLFLSGNGPFEEEQCSCCYDGPDDDG